MIVFYWSSQKKKVKFAIPETNIALKIGHPKWKLIFQLSILGAEGDDPCNTYWLVVEPTLIEKYARQIGSSS